MAITGARRTDDRAPSVPLPGRRRHPPAREDFRPRFRRTCPHSLRGLHSTLALEAGVTANAVASALGHGSFAITARHYAAPGAVDSANSRKVVTSLLGTTATQPQLSPELEQSLAALGLSEEQATSLRALFLKQRLQSGNGSGAAN